jgi:serine/threonine protein phosphatase PrpC
VHERDIATAMVGADLRSTARRLIDMALAAGAIDNVTVCLVEVLA